MDFSDLKVFLDSLLPFGVPGYDCSVRIGTKEVFRQMGGYADREKQLPITKDTIYCMYSCSKLITCATALQLLEKGKFLMTDFLDEYIPEYRHMLVRSVLPNGDVEVKEARNRIRILDLFRMSSGMDYDRNDPAFLQALKDCPNGTTREVIHAMAKKQLVFEPSSHWRYSLSHDILGGFICEITGKTLQEAMKDGIFDPLGMENSFFYPNPQQEERIATEYRYNNETRSAYLPEHPSVLSDRFGKAYESGGGGLYSTLEDYARFLVALANDGVGESGNRILSPCTIRLMRTDALTPPMRADFDWHHTKGYGYGMGCRTMVDPAQGGSLSPVGEFGWAGAAGAFALIDPELHLSLTYTQQMTNSQEPYIHPRLRNIVYAALGK